MTDPFQLLALPATATPAEVKARWRALCRTHHPDMGGDGAVFHQLRQAYERAYEVASAPKPCQACAGTGKRTVARGFTSVQLPCGDCLGDGVVS